MPRSHFAEAASDFFRRCQISPLDETASFWDYIGYFPCGMLIVIVFGAENCWEIRRQRPSAVEKRPDAGDFPLLVLPVH